MHKAVLFDFDGTLVNNLSLFIKAYDFALKKFSIHIPETEIPKACFHKSEKEVAEKFGLPSVEKFSDYYFEGVDKFNNNIQLFPGVLELLKDLREKQSKLGIVTLAKRWYIEKMLRQTGLEKFFGSVVSFDDVLNPKPDPESVYLSCKNLGIPPSDTFFIGGARGDILMGKAAGNKTALFLPDENKTFYDFEKLKETKPDFTFYNFNELKNIIL
jgi:pyrophosphatase PpaX